MKTWYKLYNHQWDDKSMESYATYRSPILAFMANTHQEAKFCSGVTANHKFNLGRKNDLMRLPFTRLYPHFLYGFADRRT